MAAFIWRIDFRNENWIDLSAINQFEFTEFANELFAAMTSVSVFINSNINFSLL